MHTSRGLHRLLAFGDAVVAIAITLLVLPLTEIRPDAYGSLGALVSAEGSALLGFAISFVVVALFWRAHHRLGELLTGYDETLMRMTIAWLMAIVVLPFTTNLADHAGPHGYAYAYLTNLLLAQALLVAMGWWAARRPALASAEGDPAALDAWRTRTVVVLVGFALALLLDLAIPALGTLSVLLLLAAPPVTWLLERRHRPRTPPSPRH